MIQVDKMTIGKSVERFGLWDKLDLDITAPAGQSPEQTYQEANELVCKLLNINTESGKPITIEQVREEEVIASPEDGLIEIINQCRTIQLLERQRKQVERMNSPLVTERFNNKMKNLKGEHN